MLKFNKYLSTLQMESRRETDLLGELKINTGSYFGIHTQRALNNFNISNSKISDYPLFIEGLVITKKACALANKDIGAIPADKADMVIQACDEVLNKMEKYLPCFPTDVYQGGAGTSVNMNINEVIANVALELNNFNKGDYDILNPNDHVNKSQSTNDAYPTGFRVATYFYINSLLKHVEHLINQIDKKSIEFSQVLKMGRTQLQDAVPMSLGDEFKACLLYTSPSPRD